MCRLCFAYATPNRAGASIAKIESMPRPIEVLNVSSVQPAAPIRINLPSDFFFAAAFSSFFYLVFYLSPPLFFLYLSSFGWGLV